MPFYESLESRRVYCTHCTASIVYQRMNTHSLLCSFFFLESNPQPECEVRFWLLYKTDIHRKQWRKFTDFFSYCNTTWKLKHNILFLKNTEQQSQNALHQKLHRIPTIFVVSADILKHNKRVKEETCRHFNFLLFSFISVYSMFW